MTSPGPRLRGRTELEALGARQDLVVSRAQLAERGCSSRDVRDKVASRAWQTYGHRVVILTATPLTVAQRWRAALLHSGPRARLGGLTALEQAGLSDWGRDDVHVVVPAGTHVTALPGLRAHRTARLPDADCRELDGLATMTPARAALDAARWDRSGATAAALMIAVIQQGLCTPEELADTLGRFVKVKQQVAIGEGLADAREGAESSAEVIAADLLVKAGFARPRRQVEIGTSLGVRRIDLVVEVGDGTFLGVEVDGPHHDEPEVRIVDAVKDAAVVAAGGSMHRVKAAAVHQTPGQVLQEFLDLRRRLA